MELRSSRSRSRTPFVQLQRLEQEQEENMSNTIKQEQIVRRYTTRHQYHQQQQQITEESTTVKTKQMSENGKQRHKTSDYSSEDDVFEVEDDASETNGKVKSALQVYKEAGEYWNKFPKTDYTYSLHSKDRVEVAPGVICMPNMSRKSLRRSMEPSSTLSTSYDTQTSASTYRNQSTYVRNHNTLQNHRKTLNFDDSYSVETTSFYRRVLTSTSSFFQRIFRSFLSVFLVVYSIVQNSTLWIARSYYQTVSRMFLFDTWLIKKATSTTSSTTSATSGKKYGVLIALMLLPLLLFAGIHVAQDGFYVLRLEKKG